MGRSTIPEKTSKFASRRAKKGLGVKWKFEPPAVPVMTARPQENVLVPSSTKSKILRLLQKFFTPYQKIFYAYSIFYAHSQQFSPPSPTTFEAHLSYFIFSLAHSFSIGSQCKNGCRQLEDLEFDSHSFPLKFTLVLVSFKMQSN